MARESFQASDRDRGHMHELPKRDEGLPSRVSVDLDNKDPDAFEIVTIDDTPEEDRGRPTELDHSLADQEVELRGVSQKTQKRIERLRFETHTERRGREAAERERDVAVQTIQEQNAEIQRLRLVAESGNTALANSLAAGTQARIDDAQRRLASAHNDGDGTAIAKATSDLSQAQAELVAIKTRTPPPRQEQPQQVQQPAPQQPQQAQLPKRVTDWVSHNREWFDSNGSNKKSADALSIHYSLVSKGVRPDSEQYTRELDKGLKSLYPDHQPFDYPLEDNGERREERTTSRRSNNVADSGRESGDHEPANPRRVELTDSELSLARRLGVTPQAYAAEKLKRQQRDQRGAR